MTWRVNFMRSKDAQKQLARTSLSFHNGGPQYILIKIPLYSFLEKSVLCPEFFKDPRFRNLGHIGAGKLHSLTPLTMHFQEFIGINLNIVSTQHSTMVIALGGVDTYQVLNTGIKVDLIITSRYLLHLTDNS